MKELILYRCEICGNIVCMVKDSGAVPSCCGQEMTHIAAKTEEDGATEKHVPVITGKGSCVHVLVGSLPHPMTAQHHISKIFLLTDKGWHVRCLAPDDAAEAVFHLSSVETVTAAYACCNIHGLWKGCEQDKHPCC